MVCCPDRLWCAVHTLNRVLHCPSCRSHRFTPPSKVPTTSPFPSGDGAIDELQTVPPSCTQHHAQARSRAHDQASRGHREAIRAWHEHEH